MNKTELEQKLQNILDEKQDVLSPDVLKKDVTFLGITGTLETGIDTSDATAVASNIEQGKTAYVNGEKVEGSLQVFGVPTDIASNVQYQENAMGNYLISSASRAQTGIIKQGTSISMQSEASKVANAIGLTPEKIVKGNTIIGVEGAAESGKQEYLSYNTLEELNAEIDNPNIAVGQKAVLYGPNEIKLEIDKMFNVIIKLGKSFILTEEQKTYITDNRYVSISTSGDYELNTSGISMSIYPTYATLSISDSYDMGSNILARYESTDGLIYNAVYEYTEYDWLTDEEVTRTFVYEGIECNNAVYNEENKTEANAFAYTILQSLLESVGITKLQGVYRYEDEISNSYKIQYCMNMTYSGSIKNGNTDDFVYTDKAYTFIKEQYQQIEGAASSTSEIMIINTIDDSKNVISGDIYIYPDSINTFMLVNTDNTVSACFRTKTCKKYHFDLSTSTFEFIEDVLNDSVAGYRSDTKYTVQVITVINNDKKVILSSNMNHAYVYEGLYYSTGKYLNYSFTTMYSTMYQILPTQFTITKNDVDNVMGKYTMLGKDGEIATNDTWPKQFGQDKYNRIMPFINFKDAKYLSYNLNHPALPELSEKLVYQLCNLKYNTLEDVTTNYLTYGANADCATQYGFISKNEQLCKIDVTNVPHMSEFNGYWYQTNSYEFIDDTGIAHILYTSTRNTYAFYFEINPETGEYTSKQYQTLGDDSQYAITHGDYWCIVSRNTDNSSTEFVTQFQVIEKMTGNLVDTFTVNYGVISDLYSFSTDVWFTSDVPSAATFNAICFARCGEYSAYTYKIYKFTNSTTCSLLVQDTTARYSLYDYDTTRNQVIICSKVTSSDDTTYELVWPTAFKKQVYGLKQMQINGIYQYTYSTDPSATYDWEGTRYTIIDGQEVDISTIDIPRETITIDGVKYYKSEIGPCEEGYNCELENVDTGEIIVKAIPSFYYNYTTHNDYQYVADATFDADTDSDYSTGERVTTSYITINRYKFTACQANIVTENNATDLLGLCSYNNTPGEQKISNVYLLSTDNLDILIAGGGQSGPITQEEYDTALDTASEILGEEV